MDTHRIIKVGNISTNNSECGMVYSTEGVSMSLIAGCHGYAMGQILEVKEEDDN